MSLPGHASNWGKTGLDVRYDGNCMMNMVVFGHRIRVRIRNLCKVVRAVRKRLGDSEIGSANKNLVPLDSEKQTSVRQFLKTSNILENKLMTIISVFTHNKQAIKLIDNTQIGIKNYYYGSKSMRSLGDVRFTTAIRRTHAIEVEPVCAWAMPFFGLSRQ